MTPDGSTSDLYRRLAESAEAQRREIAKELHDEIGQQLTALKMQLDLGTREAVYRASEIADELMASVRSMSLDLRPPLLDDLGLVPALRDHIQRFTERTGVEVDFAVAGVGQRMEQGVELAAFRIVQEALTNVAKHSGARWASVRIAAAGGTLILRIEDEGRGAEPAQATTPTPATTTGLPGMQERAAAVGGTLTLDTSPGHGTVVTAKLPVAAAS